MRLGNFSFTHPVVALAPMAGISDLPYRRISHQFGADLTTAEMISAKPELLDTPLAQTRLQFCAHIQAPKIVQLVGADSYLMAEAAQQVQAQGADVIDINMGCPAKTIGKQQAGSALLANPARALSIIRACVNAVKIPVTLKTRLGIDANHIQIVEFAEKAEQAGIAMISIHGRTRAQKFQGVAEYGEIAKVKQRLKIPVLVNGDITSATQASALVAEYGFDGVMIGRAALGNPWLLANTRCQFDREYVLPEIDAHRLIYQHVSDLHALYGAQGVQIARKHLHAYAKTLNLAPEYRQALNQAHCAASQLAVVMEYYGRIAA